MPRFTRLAVLVFVMTLVITGLQTPRPAAAVYTWYGADLNNWSFTRADGTPLMTKQNTCYKCVASGTQAWTEYTWVASGNNTHGPAQGYDQDFYWNYFNTTNAQPSSWGSYVNATGDSTVSPSCTGTAYPRRVLNNSKDDGVDPYAQSWGVFSYTPGGYYYHQIRYEDGTNYTGYYTGSHSIAATLSHYHEPVGTFIGNGGHFVLAAAAETFDDPNVNFYTSILNMLIRDPQLDPGAYPYTGNRVTYAYDTTQAGSWGTVFTRYGYVGVDQNVIPGYGMTTTAPPYSGNGGWTDDVELGPYVGSRASSGNGWRGFWWGRYVVVKRDDTAANPDNQVWFFAQ